MGYTYGAPANSDPCESCSAYPKICACIICQLEVNRFAFMELDAGHKMYDDAFCHGTLFGFIFGFIDRNEAIYAAQDGKCLLCGSSIEHIHHVVPHSKGGNDTISNKVGLCKRCHIEVHTDPAAAEQLPVSRQSMLERAC